MQDEGPEVSERTLFDDLEPESVLPLGNSTWEEVPQARFLSWSPQGQALYCSQRDEDSAKHEDDPEMRAFYLERAAMYEELSLCKTIT